MDELIMKAAQYMDEHGKCKGDFDQPDGSVCIYGALRMAAFGAITLSRVRGQDAAWGDYNVATVRIENYASHVHGSAATYVNDITLKTKEETVKFMMEAAEWEPTNA